MSEQSPEQGMDFNKSFHDMMDTLDDVPLNAQLASFDTVRANLYDSLAELAAKMPSVIETKEQATVKLDGVAERLAGVLTVMVRDGADSDAIIDTTVGLMLKDSTERVELMNALIGAQDMINFKPESLKNLITDCLAHAETTEQAIENIEKIYHTDLADDVNIFLQLLAHKFQHLLNEQSESPSQTIEIKKDMKDHISDIAKVALGVTLALAADRFIHKKA